MRRRFEPGVWLLVLILPCAILPCAASADALDRARKLALEGQHSQAREAAREVLRDNVNDPEALQIVVVASCQLGDGAMARLAYERLAPDVQSMAARHCSRRGIDLTRPPPPAATSAAPAPTEAPHAGAPNRRLPWRVAFWTTAGGSLAAIIASAVLGTQVARLSLEKDELVLSHRRKTGRMDWGGSADVCAEAEADGVSELIEHCARGKRTAVAGNVMLGLGLAGTVVSIYLYHRAYIKQERPPPRVSLSPTLSPTSGGLSLRLSY